MRKLLFFVPFALCACGEIELPDAQPEEKPIEEEFTKNFTFTLKGDFSSMKDDVDDTGGLGLHNKYVEGPMYAPAKANQYMTADGVEMTDMWVLDVVSGEVKQTLHQQPSDADWGAPSMLLTLGTHHVLFLASRGQNPTFTDGVVTWTKPLDTFFLDYEVTVVKTSNGNRAVTLNRVATKLQVVIEDSMPTGTTSVSLAPSRWFTGWNMLKASPIEGTYTGSFTMSQAQWGAKGIELNMWSLSGADEWTTDVAITSKIGDTTNAETTITDAPMKANRITRFTGSLYSTTSSTNVSLATDWLTQYDSTF